MLSDYKVNIDDKAREIADIFNKENIYLDFIKAQEDGFMRFIQYINEKVDILKKQAKISPFIEIRARIKDTKSAIKNFGYDKMLDDVFGVEIICANENEIKIIKEELEKCFKSTRHKTHNKPNGYKAEHESYSVKHSIQDNQVEQYRLKDDDVPVVECQFKTIEVELNPEASHHDYKKVNREVIQTELENKVLDIGEDIPKMWVSRENGMVELTYKEVIQRIYPFVDITRIKEEERNIKFNDER